MGETQRNVQVTSCLYIYTITLLDIAWLPHSEKAGRIDESMDQCLSLNLDLSCTLTWETYSFCPGWHEWQYYAHNHKIWTESTRLQAWRNCRLGRVFAYCRIEASRRVVAVWDSYQIKFGQDLNLFKVSGGHQLRSVISNATAWKTKFDD